jgi:hypothetical protein
VWVLIGAIALLVMLSLVVLGLATVLRKIGHDVFQLLELEPWATGPPLGDGFVEDRARPPIEESPRAHELSWRRSAVRPERSQRNA